MTALATITSHPYPDDGGFHAWFLLFPLGFILFWVVVIVLLRTVLWRRWGGPWGRGPGRWTATSSAEQALATRFAAGDIDEQEYRARLEVLRASPPDAG